MSPKALEQNMKNKFLIIPIVFISLMGLFGVVNKIQAANVWGYAWSENIGWIKMNAGAPHWQLVNDISPDYDNSYIYTNSLTFLNDAYNLEDPPSAALTQTISSVTVSGDCRDAAIRMALRLNGNEAGAASSLCSLGTWGDFGPTVPMPRPGGGSWTWPDISNLQLVIGLRKFNASDPAAKLTQAYVGVNTNVGNTYILRPNAEGDYQNIEGPAFGNPYGVTINTSNGIFSGWAWSSNVGWISFNQADLAGCPSGACEAKINLTTGAISGWAKPWRLVEDMYEYLNPAYDDEVSLTSPVIFSQSFTVGSSGPSRNFFVTKVKILAHIDSYGTPFNITARIRDTEIRYNDFKFENDIYPKSKFWDPNAGCCGDWVDSPDLCMGVITSRDLPNNHTDWAEIQMSSGCNLLAGHTYALLIDTMNFGSDGNPTQTAASDQTGLAVVRTIDAGGPGDLYPGGNIKFTGLYHGYGQANTAPVDWNDYRTGSALPPGYIIFTDDYPFQIWGTDSSSWIKLNPTSAGSNGVHLTGHDFYGWAFGGGDDNNKAIIGWTSFNRANCDTDQDGFSNGSIGCPPAGTVISNYKVETDFSTNAPPTAVDLNKTQGDYCFAPNPPIILNWTFSDLNAGDIQQSYQIQIDNSGSSFPSPEIDSGVVNGGSSSFAPIGLSFGTTYWWRVKVWDNKGAESNWVSGVSFPTASNRYPNTSFSSDQTNPLPDRPVVFTNNSTCYNSAGGAVPCSSYHWDFGDGTTVDTLTSAPQTHSYATNGPYTVQLNATDASGNTCSASIGISVRRSLPSWQEVPPTF